MGQDQGPSPPFASANEQHAGDADKFASEEDPRPHGFVVHDIDCGRKMTSETAEVCTRIAL